MFMAGAYWDLDPRPTASRIVRSPSLAPLQKLWKFDQAEKAKPESLGEANVPTQKAANHKDRLQHENNLLQTQRMPLGSASVRSTPLAVSLGRSHIKCNGVLAVGAFFDPGTRGVRKWLIFTR